MVWSAAGLKRRQTSSRLDRPTLSRGVLRVNTVRRNVRCWAKVVDAWTSENLSKAVASLVEMSRAAFANNAAVQLASRASRNLPFVQLAFFTAYDCFRGSDQVVPMSQSGGKRTLTRASMKHAP